jgi:hypothetical protein
MSLESLLDSWTTEEFWQETSIKNGEAWLAWKPAGPYGASREYDVVGDRYTRSESASLSRTLRRLRQRGLLETWNDITGSSRTTVVHLTPTGREIAEGLAEENWGADWLEAERMKFAQDKNG